MTGKKIQKDIHFYKTCLTLTRDIFLSQEAIVIMELVKG